MDSSAPWEPLEPYGGGRMERHTVAGACEGMRACEPARFGCAQRPHVLGHAEHVASQSVEAVHVALVLSESLSLPYHRCVSEYSHCIEVVLNPS